MTMFNVGDKISAEVFGEILEVIEKELDLGDEGPPLSIVHYKIKTKSGKIIIVCESVVRSI